MKRSMAGGMLAALVVLAVSASRAGLAAGAATPPPDLEAWSARALDTFHTPGAAMRTPPVARAGRRSSAQAEKRYQGTRSSGRGRAKASATIPNSKAPSPS